jgi:hypothetical protein
MSNHKRESNEENDIAPPTNFERMNKARNEKKGIVSTKLALLAGQCAVATIRPR